MLQESQSVPSLYRKPDLVKASDGAHRVNSFQKTTVVTANVFQVDV